MPVYEAPVVDNVFATDAEYRAWIVHFESALLASGFLELAPDTGQIDLATVVRPAVSTYSGYRMYRAKDALSATKPYYVKVEYGVGSVIDRYTVKKSLGTGSNGAGTLTGPTQTAASITAASAAGSGAQQIYGGGNDHCAWVFVYDLGVASNQSFWMLGRFLDQETGEADDPIIWDFYISSGSATAGGQFNYTDGSIAWTSNSTGIYSFFPDLAAGPTSGGTIETTLLVQGPIYRNGRMKVFSLLLGRAGELAYTTPGDSTFSLNVWGAMRTFVVIPFTASISGHRMCVPWEV